MKRVVKSSSYATNAIRSRINNMLVDGTNQFHNMYIQKD